MSKKASNNPIVQNVQRRQNAAIKVLYAAMILKAIAAFWSLMEFPSGVLLFLFFVMEIFILPPVGMIYMIIVASVLFFILQNVVYILVGLAAGSILILFIGMGLSMMLTGFVLTFLDGWLISIEYISTAAPMTVGLAVTGAAAASAAAAGAAVDVAVSQAGKFRWKKRRKMLCSLIIFLVLGWPMLSYAQAISGVIACKPAAILNQAHLVYLNYGDKHEARKFFEDEDQWLFQNGFYADYIYGKSNDISQGGKTLIAGDENNLAVLYNHMLYFEDVEAKKNLYSYGYVPRKTDAMVIHGNRTVIFGHDRVTLMEEDGWYTWKDTKWTSEFEAMSQEEQIEYVYDILERQNTEEPARFSYEEVGAVAYAQRSGLLLTYFTDTHRALFAMEKEDGTVDVYAQRGPKQRELTVSFTPKSKGEGLPYCYREAGIIYIKGTEIRYLSERNGWKETRHFLNPECKDEEGNPMQHELVSLHYLDNGDDGTYLVYVDEADRICVDLLGKDSVNTFSVDIHTNKAAGFGGGYFYVIKYDDSKLLNKLTFLRDTADNGGWKASQVWRDAWDYSRMKMVKANYDPEIAAQEEAERKAREEAEKTMEERYPAPQVRRRRSNTDPFDMDFIVAGKYAGYTGPQDRFWFSYPPSLYDSVDYTMENDGADIDIVFTGPSGAGSLTVSIHPLPEDAGDPGAYAERLCEDAVPSIDNGKTQYYEGADGVYQFRVKNKDASSSTQVTNVICRVDSENVMRMVIQYPGGRDDEDRVVKAYYAEMMDYKCGFGHITKQPNWTAFKKNH